MSDATAAPAVPSATVVLMRDAPVGLEVLLLRRVASAGFVPGVWVFPGGRVESSDGDPALVALLDGVDPDTADRRLGLTSDADPPAVAYYVAALREAFEETGLLVGVDRHGRPAPCAAGDPLVTAQLEAARHPDGNFGAALAQLGCRLDGGAMSYVGHWITPLSAPIRYDTRFFAAGVPAGHGVAPHAAEVGAAAWLTPADALARSEAGALPMVAPTLHTLAALRGLDAVRDVTTAFRGREIPTILPLRRSTPRRSGVDPSDGDL